MTNKVVASVIVCHALAKAASGISLIAWLAGGDPQPGRNSRSTSLAGHTGVQHDGPGS
jgi:hypothetical protein